MAADGSIIIDTRIQTEGLSKGLSTIKAGMTRITAQVSKMGETAKNSFQRQIATVNSLYQSYEKQEKNNKLVLVMQNLQKAAARVTKREESVKNQHYGGKRWSLCHIQSKSNNIFTHGC